MTEVRLIDANTLMPLFVQKAFTIQDRHGVKIGEHWLLDYDDIKEVIDNAPTVEYPFYQEAYQTGYEEGKNERPRGEWVGNAFDEHHCKRCGHPALWEEEPDGYYEVQSRFCPNCGADMQKGGAE